MDGVNVIMAVMGMGELCLGAYVLTTGRVPGGYVPSPERIRKLGVFFILISGFFLFQVAGYAGVRLDLFSRGIRSVLVLTAFAVGVIALIKYWPQFALSKVRQQAEDVSTDQHD
ncbi:hypothetical protein CLV67_11999 [Actinoplanes italicus]|uniref:Uncharacterized protein n=2 Tax=Actinoplanes italicus TaxID=113567 RepID=A0A2T0K148_9ACTN|nr:hypothetical protein CLV67_11999 [Actinoplanes italicus]